MRVVLSILQVIGWILLVLLILVFLVLLLVLFCPIQYRIEGEVLEATRIKAKVNWLFHLIRAKAAYGEDLVYAEVSILWIKKTFSYDLTKSEEKEPKPKKEKKEATEEEKESIISKVKGMIERIKEIYPKIKKMIQDEQNKDGVSHIKKEILYIIKKLLPKESSVNAQFSTGSPDTTGQIFGVIACFPTVYRNGWSLLPDFESDEAYFKGTFYGKSKIYLYQSVGAILRIVFDKKCRRLYTIINVFMKSINKESVQEEK